MKKYLIIMILLFFITPVFARSIPNIPNEVKDPWFLDIPNNWYTLGDYTLIPNGVYLPGYTIDPGNKPTDNVYIRTIIDDSLSPGWNPNYNNKEIDLSFFGHVSGAGVIFVMFYYWTDNSIPQPPLDPFTPFPYPHEETLMVYVNESDISDFTIRNDLLNPGETLPPGYNLYNLHFYLPSQPRWMSIEIYLNKYFSNEGEVSLTGVDFEARCVEAPIPEPMTICLFWFSILALFFKRLRS